MVLVPSEFAKSCKPLPQASASPLLGLIHVQSLQSGQLQDLPLGLSQSGHPCFVLSTSGQGLETHLCSGPSRTLVSYCFYDGLQQGCQCEQLGQKYVVPESQMNHPQELVPVMPFPWKHWDLESMHLLCWQRDGQMGTEGVG